MKILQIILFPLLWVMSLLYTLVIIIIRKLYRKGVLPVKELSSGKVICVGNITAGGTGKTSMVINLAEYFISQGYKIAILTRGYKRQTLKQSLVVSTQESVEESGDEPYLLKKKLPGCTVIVGSDRYNSGKMALSKFQSQILLLDDGFQHWKLSRNFDIVLIDCLDPWGGGFIPLGILREPLNGLVRSNMIVLTHCDLVEDKIVDSVINKIKRMNSQSVIFKSIHKPVGLQGFRKWVISSSFSEEQVELSWLSGRNVSILSGIGNPLSLEKILLSLGANILNKYEFRDHHWYKVEELKSILNQNECVVTTEKDAVRINLIKDKIGELVKKLYVLNIKFQLDCEKEWIKNIDGLMRLKEKN